ncbi:MAG: hypothetical protein GX963_09055 [Bacteroidales bacterium]|nr:hypothetical protein [Bacteroidales bacterium]
MIQTITINLIDHSTGNAYITSAFKEDLTELNGDITFDKVKFLFNSEFDLDLKESECSWGIIKSLQTTFMETHF